MVTNWDIRRNSSFRNMIISLFVLWLIIVLTIWLWFYNKSNTNKLSVLNTDLWDINNEIKNISKDPTVELYSLIYENKSNLELFEKYSQITNFIAELKNIERDSRISFSSFNYNNWVITLNATAFNDGELLATQKVDNFLSAFRTGEYDWIFELSFINNFVGQESINFVANFNIK